MGLRCVPYVNKFWTLTASIAVALCAGVTYSFPIWSSVLKDTYALSQEQLQLIASTANVGGYSSIISGLVYDLLAKHKKVGPRVVLLIGSVANAAGYLGLWAAIQGLFQAQLWHLAALAALAANGGTWSDTTAMATNVRNFPSSRGSVVGVLKASVGLSGSLFAMCYAGAFKPDKHSFLLFLAFAPVLVSLVALPLINTCTFVQRSELEAGQHVFTTEGRFIFSFQTLSTLAVYLIIGATLSSLYPLSRLARLVVLAGAGLLLLPLLLIPVGSGGLVAQQAEVCYSHLSNYDPDSEAEEEEEEEEEEEAGHRLHNPAQVPLLAGAADEPAPGAVVVRPAFGQGMAAAPTTPAGPIPDLSPWECLQSFSFWLLFGVLVIGMGSGLALLNNLAQVVKALSGAGSEATPVLVSLFSVSNCAGRMLLGYLPERRLHAKGTPRLFFLPAVSACMAVTCLCLAFARMALLFPLAAAAGFSFGGLWSLFPAYVSEIFGLRRFAANYSLMQLAPALGSFGLAMGLAGHFYEHALAKHGTLGNTCVGQDCFRPTFLILAALGGVATTAALLLCQREQGLYKHHARELHTYDEEVLREETRVPTRSV